MNKLKTNWAIRTTDEQFKAYILTLEALGYTIYPHTKKGDSMEDYRLLCVSSEDGMICRCYKALDLKDFPDISSFLIYHFSEEKTEAERELEALQEKMNSLQEQVDRVKLSISK